MSGGGKGGKQTTEVKIPAWLEAGAKNNMARADELAQIGYTPHFGPDVAAFTPMQQAAFQGTADAASAFGQAAPVNPMGGMPQAMTFADGTTGYSSAPLFEQSLAALAAARPGQFAALQAPFINPVTGAEPASPFGSGGGGQGRATQMDPMMAVMAAMTGVGGDRRSGGGFGGFQPARPSGGGGGLLSSQFASRLPGGINTANPNSVINRTAAALTSRPQGAPTAANRPMSRPTGR